MKTKVRKKKQDLYRVEAQSWNINWMGITLHGQEVMDRGVTTSGTLSKTELLFSCLHQFIRTSNPTSNGKELQS